MTKKKVTNQLKKHICKVTFTKKTGDLRTFEQCTLNPDVMKQFIPTTVADPNKKPKAEISTDSISVFSIDDNGWRAFKLDSLISIEKCK